MSIISSFRTDFSSALFSNVKGVWWRYVVVVTVLMIISAIFTLLFLGSFINMEFMQEMMADPQGFFEQLEQNPQMLESSMYNPGQQPGVFATIMIYVFSLGLTAWLANIFLLINDSNIRNSSASFSAVLSEASGKMLLNQIGHILVLYLGMIIAFLLIGLLTFLHWSLMVLGFLVFLFAVIRFIMSSAAIVHGRMGVFCSASPSFNQSGA